MQSVGAVVALPEQCRQGGAGRAVQAGWCMPAYRCRAFEACCVARIRMSNCVAAVRLTHRKLRPKSIQNRARDPPGAPGLPVWGLPTRKKQLKCAIIRATCSRRTCEASLRRFWLDFRLERARPDLHEVSRLSAKTKVQLCALRVESHLQRNFKKPRTLIRKLIKDRGKSSLGTARAPSSIDFGRSGRLRRAIKRLPGDPARSRSLGKAPRSLRHARTMRADAKILKLFAATSILMIE